MFKTLMWSGALLAVAIGGPAGIFQFSDFWNDLKNGKIGISEKTVAVDADAPTKTDAGRKPTANVITSPTNLAIDAAPVLSLEEVFRFDLAPADVLRRWPRVSTELPYLHLHGYRVPLVSGTDAPALAGALTYYFNPSQQVQRITFRGTTGDPRAIVLLLTSRYHYARRPNNDPSRLVYESINSTGQLAGQVVIRTAPVVRQNDPFKRYDIDLTMDRPEK
ncbi:MAG: hypothetical protein IT426_19480 [Pirellulales bacterium]|nr:hypothetical protein [Pirellulales bacterium]